MYIKFCCLFPNIKHCQVSMNPFSQADKMTSPAIIKSPKDHKDANKSHTHSPATQPQSQKNSAVSSTSTSSSERPEAFSWLRVFKLADLMMKQGC